MLDFSVTFIITIINITVLFFILRAVLFKPVTKFMADRAERIQCSIDQAEEAKEKAHKLLAEYKEKIKDAEAEAREILITARENASRQSRQIVIEGIRDAENFAASMRLQIEKEQQAALIKFRMEAAALVIAASAKLTAKDFSGEDNRRYANMLFDEISGAFSPQKGNS